MATTATKILRKSELERFRGLLEAKAEELRAALRSSRAGKRLVGEQTSNLEDLPVQSHEEWIFLNRNSIDVALLREIQDALLRIDEGSFGECQECAEPISQKRLDAIPWARCCITCQEELAAIEMESAHAAKPRFD